MVNATDIKEAWGQLNEDPVKEAETTDKVDEDTTSDVEIIKEDDSEDVALIKEEEKEEEKKEEEGVEEKEEEEKEEGVIDIDETYKTDISDIDISEKTGGEFKNIDELLESYSSLKEKTQPIDNVFEYLDNQSFEKIGLSFSELASYRTLDFDNMNEFDVLAEYQQMKDPDISEIEIQSELKQFEVLSKTESEIAEMIEDGDLTQNEYDLISAKFNRTIRTARRELKEFRDTLELDNIELPVSISQEDKPKQFTQEDIDNHAKTISEELKSFKTLRLRLDSKDSNSNLDFKITDEERDSLTNNVKHPTWLVDRWSGEDGQIDKTKAYKDAYVLMNLNKMVKTAYNEGVARGKKDNVVEEDNISLKGKSKATQTSKTDPMVDAIQKWESKYGGR